MTGLLHFVRILAASGLAVLGMFLPFMPGSYDSLAVIVSGMAQLLGFAALPLVPLGIWWWAYERMKRNKDENRSRAGRRFGVAALTILSFAVVGASFAAWGGIGSYRGSAVLALGLLSGYLCILVTGLVPRVWKAIRTEDRKPSAIPLYLILIPLIVAIVRSAFLTPAIEYGRDRAIERSGALIRDLEAYYAQNGHYPVSLQGVWKDYYPGVIGIEKYYYEPNGEAYNLYFESIAADFTVREFVMYNKRDEHIIRSHPSFLFSLSPAQFAGYRGYFADRELPQPHWKSFLFD